MKAGGIIITIINHDCLFISACTCMIFLPLIFFIYVNLFAVEVVFFFFFFFLHVQKIFVYVTKLS